MNLKKILKASMAIGAAFLSFTGLFSQTVQAANSDPDIKDDTTDGKELSCAEAMQKLLRVDVAEGDASKYTGMDLPDGRHIYEEGGRYFVSAGGKMTALPVVDGTLSFNDIKYVKKVDSLIEDVYTTDEGSKISIGKCGEKNALVVDGRVIKNATDDGLLRLDKVAKAIGFELEGNTLKFGDKISISVGRRYVKVSGNKVESKKEKLEEISKSGGDVYVSFDFFEKVFGVKAISNGGNLYISGNDLMPRYYVLNKDVKLSAESKRTAVTKIPKKLKEKKKPGKNVDLSTYKFGETKYKDKNGVELYMCPSDAIYRNGYVIPADHRTPYTSLGGCEVCDLYNPSIKGSFYFKQAPIKKDGRTGYCVGDRVFLNLNDKGIDGSPTFYIDGYRTWYTYDKVVYRSGGTNGWRESWNGDEYPSLDFDAIIDFANCFYSKAPAKSLGDIARELDLNINDGDELDREGEKVKADTILRKHIINMYLNGERTSYQDNLSVDIAQLCLSPFDEDLNPDYESLLNHGNASIDIRVDLNGHE